jgi:3-oxoacyl-[acyl-carrier-protein] synthase II
MNRENPVVITGVGAITALGLDAKTTWDAILAGKQGVRDLKGFDATGFGCRVGAQVTGFESAALRFSSKLARVLDLHSFMLLQCARETFVQAGLNATEVAPESLGLFVGMGMVDYRIQDLLPAVLASMDTGGALDMEIFYAQGYQEIYPLITLAMLNNVSLCEVAIQLNIRGENCVFSPHADSGGQAVAEAVKTLREQKAAVALAGGVSEKISPLGLARAHYLGLLNTTDAVSMPCRPFAANRKGTVLGEGCGILSLELRQTADQRGAPYHVMITGCGSAFEAQTGAYAPTANAVTRAMQQALASAALNPEDVDAVIAHGDGTPVGDANEIDAIHQVFSRCLDRIAVFSSKGFLGHLLAGAAAVDLVLATYMIAQGVIPPTLSSVTPDERIRFPLVTDQPLKCALRRVLLNCRSNEGQCVSLLVEAVD